MRKSILHGFWPPYLGAAYPRARRAFLWEWRFAAATLGRVRLAVVAALLAMTLFTAITIPLSFVCPVLEWWCGDWQSTQWQGSVTRGNIDVTRYAPDPGPSRQISGPFRTMVIDYASFVEPIFGASMPPPLKRITYVKVRSWAAMSAFATYPVIVIISFLRGPLRRRRRQEKGLCTECGYDLAGLVEPRCPECGQPFAGRQREMAIGD